MCRSGWEPEVYNQMIQFIKEHYLNMTEEEINNWIKKHPELLDIVKKELEK